MTEAALPPTSRKSFLTPMQWGVFAVVTLVALVVVPLLNSMVPEESAWHLADHDVQRYGKYLSWAILALSVGLIWGYAGILSLGHAAFFAIGGYCLGMLKIE